MAESLPRVVIDLEKLQHINCGLGRFSLHLAREILHVAPGRFRPVFFMPSAARGYFADGGGDVIQVADWRKETIWRFARPIVQPFLAAPGIRLWHVTHQGSKYLPLDGRIPILLTIHDLNFLHEQPERIRSISTRRELAGIQRLVDRASAIVTVSQFTADDVRRHLEVRDKPLHVVPNGMSPAPRASEQRPAFLPEGPFLLTVGNALQHKNFHVLLGMIEHLPGRRLVIAGKKTTRYGRFLAAEIRRRGLSDRVLQTGEVSDGDRQWLYEHCDAFLFPSLAEGFGFPVLEAMQCGRPVFAARKTSLPEIGGDVAFYFDSFEPAHMAATLGEGLRRIAKDHNYQDRARSHAAAFSWSEAARRYTDIYDAVINGL
jgi:glycosyltransferase involved in cell wall biosynthesis